MRWIIVGVFVLQLQHLWAQRPPLIPDFAILQYAGSIGYVSVGVGYDVFKRHFLSAHYGFVPKSNGGELNILASKLMFNIWSFQAGPCVKIDAFSAGAMISYHLGNQFRSRWPSHRYPDGYYWWKTSLRAHIIAETLVTFQLNHKPFESVSVFMEVNTNELYLISLVKNMRSLRPTDIFKAGYGIRARF